MNWRTLTIDEKSYGPGIQLSIPFASATWRNCCRTEPAEGAGPMRRALAIDEKSFGRSIRCRRDLNHLAQLLQDTNRQAEAQPLM